MAAEPTDYPEWASDPPANTITSPTAPQREEGYQPGSPRRQHTNWLFNLIYQWVLWIAQTIRGFAGILFDDQATTLGTPPAVAPGLTLLEGAFSGAAIVGGNFVGVTDSPAITLTASRRYYWDLGKDGVWDYTATLLAAGAPAVAADHVRVYVFTTDGSGVDSVTLPSEARVAARGGIDLGASLTGAANQPLVRVDRSSFTGRYVELWYDEDAETAFYTTTDLLGAGDIGSCLVTNARWVEGTGWVRTTTAEPAVMHAKSRYGWLLFVATDAGAGADWPDTITGSSWVQMAALTEEGALSAVDLVVSDDATVQGDLAVTGEVAGGTLDVSGNAAVGGSATITGDATISGNAAVVHDLDVGDDLTAGTVESALVTAVAVDTGIVRFGAPPVGTPAANQADRETFPKALALLTINDAGTVTIAKQRNIASVTLVNSYGVNDTLRFTFDRAFANANIVVEGIARRDNSGGGAPVAPALPFVVARATTYVDIALWSLQAAAVATLDAADSLSWEVNATFYGTQ